MGRNPRHPKREIAGLRERKSLGVPETATKIGVERTAPADVLVERASVTLGLAKRLEAAGWDTARHCWEMHREQDRAQARRKIACDGNGGGNCNGSGTGMAMGDSTLVATHGWWLAAGSAVAL